MHHLARGIFSWFGSDVGTLRRSRRLGSLPKRLVKVRRRSRASTTSTYYTVDDSIIEWTDRESQVNPNNHKDTFLEPFRPWKIDLLMELEPISQKLKEDHAFNAEDASPHIHLLEDNVTMHRLPVAQSTDAIRGKIGFENGLHVWKIHWPVRQRGTNAVIGVATMAHPLHGLGYVSLVGSDETGFGWDISKGVCFHNGKEKDSWQYPDPLIFGGSYVVPSDIYCILDMDEGYLAFSTVNHFLGVAFRGLKDMRLYPIVSAVWGHCEVSMEYMGSIHMVAPLAELCRREIRDQFLRDGSVRVDDLLLPDNLKQYIAFESLD